MSTLESTISDGYPIDGKLFEPPQQSRDLEQPRYVTILGSLIEPQVAQDRPWTKAGGVEFTNPCLRYVKHFIRKGRITPVLRDTYDWMTTDMWEKSTGKDASYFPQPIPPGYIAPTNENGHPTPLKAMMGRMARPGEQINVIVNGSSPLLGSGRIGMVELTELSGVPYDPDERGIDRNIWEIQTAIFPDFPRLPLLLDEIEALLDDAAVHTAIRSIVDKFSNSLNQFRDYATSTVEQLHYTMRESGAKSPNGYIPRYTDQAFVLLEQLGRAREDITIRKEAKATDSDLQAMFKQWLQISLEEKVAIAESRKVAPPDATDGYLGYPGQSGYSGFSGEVVGEYNRPPAGLVAVIDDTSRTLGSVNYAQPPAAEATAPTAPETFVCPDCGDPFAKASGLALHQRRWCKSRKVGEETA